MWPVTCKTLSSLLVLCYAVMTQDGCFDDAPEVDHRYLLRSHFVVYVLIYVSSLLPHHEVCV